MLETIIALSAGFGMLLGANLILFLVWAIDFGKRRRNHLLSKLCPKCREIYLMFKGKDIL